MKNPLLGLRIFVAVLTALIFLTSCHSEDLEGFKVREVSPVVLDYMVKTDSSEYKFKSVETGYTSTDKNVQEHTQEKIIANEEIYMDVISYEDTTTLSIYLNYEFNPFDIRVIDYGIFGNDWEPKSVVNKANLYQESLTSVVVSFERYNYTFEENDEIYDFITFSTNNGNNKFNVLLEMNAFEHLMTSDVPALRLNDCEIKRLSLTMELE